MKSFNEELQEFVEICNYMDEVEDAILYKSGIDREEAYQRLYDKAFSDSINGRLQEIYPFEWTNIDGSYADDYCGWKAGMLVALAEVKKMLDED